MRNALAMVGLVAGMTACAEGTVVGPVGTRGPLSGGDASSASECSRGLTYCEISGCTDTQTDPDNCGDCDNVCPDGTACVRGTCAAMSSSDGGADVACPAPNTLCGSHCVDTSSDTTNCGSCGTACASDESCVSGSCQPSMSSPPPPPPTPPPPSCDPGLTLCGSDCIDTTSDDGNCGGCGHACSSDSYCSGGTCTPTMPTSTPQPPPPPPPPPPRCGDGVCNGTENACSCPGDCHNEICCAVRCCDTYIDSHPEPTWAACTYFAEVQSCLHHGRNFRWRWGSECQERSTPCPCCSSHTCPGGGPAFSWCAPTRTC